MSRRQLKLETYVSSGFDYAALGDEDAAAAAKAAADRIRGHQKAAIVDIGRELVAMKEKLGHGKFIDWVENELSISRRTATNMMTVATRFGDQARWETVSHLPTKLLYDLAAESTPETVRKAALAVEPGKKIYAAFVRHTIAAEKRLDNTVQRRAATREARLLEQKNDPGMLKRKAREEKERVAYEKKKAEEAERTDKAAAMVIAALGNDAPVVGNLIQEGVETWRFVEELRRLALGEPAKPPRTWPAWLDRTSRGDAA